MREFIEFLATWLETGYEWYAENPKLITGWKFGHDINSDFNNKWYKNDAVRPVAHARFAIFELLPVIIVSTERTKDSETVIKWIREGGSIPNIDFVAKQML